MDILLFSFYLIGGTTLAYTLIQILYCSLDKNAILFDAKNNGWTDVTIKWIWILKVRIKRRYYCVTYKDEKGKSIIRYCEVNLLHRY